MKKSIKIILISLGTLVFLAALTIGILYLYLHHEIKEEAENTLETPVELIEIRDFSMVVYDALPNEVSESFNLKTVFVGYEEFKITYSSSDEAHLSNTGVVIRDLLDHLVSLNYKISYKGYENSYSKTIKVLKTNNKLTANKILGILEKQIKPDAKEGTVLPESLEEFPGITIVWDKKIINRQTGEVDESIEVLEKSGQLVLHFKEAKTKEVCFLYVTIKINGMDFNNNLVIYTKTNI